MEIIHYHSLYQAVSLQLEQHRRNARVGHKDEPRAFLRFVQNGRIIEILHAQDWPKGLGVDVPLLAWKLGELEKEVHPLAVSDNTDELSCINRSLHLIAAGVARLMAEQDLRKTRKVKPTPSRV